MRAASETLRHLAEHAGKACKAIRGELEELREDVAVMQQQMRTLRDAPWTRPGELRDYSRSIRDLKKAQKEVRRKLRKAKAAHVVSRCTAQHVCSSRQQAQDKLLLEVNFWLCAGRGRGPHGAQGGVTEQMPEGEHREHLAAAKALGSCMGICWLTGLAAWNHNVNKG